MTTSNDAIKNGGLSAQADYAATNLLSSAMEVQCWRGLWDHMEEVFEEQHARSGPGAEQQRAQAVSELLAIADRLTRSYQSLLQALAVAQLSIPEVDDIVISGQNLRKQDAGIDIDKVREKISQSFTELPSVIAEETGYLWDRCSQLISDSEAPPVAPRRMTTAGCSIAAAATGAAAASLQFHLAAIGAFVIATQCME